MAARKTVELGELDRFVDVKEAARILHISEASVRRFLTQQRLKRFKCGARTLLDRAEVLSLITEA